MSRSSARRAHELRVNEPGDHDDLLRGWLQESYDVVGLQATLPVRPGRP